MIASTAAVKAVLRTQSSRFFVRKSQQQQLRSLSSSHWGSYEMGPPDPIVGLNDAFRNDSYPNKVNVGVGAYRDDSGKPMVLPVVREAEKMIQEQQLDHEYSGIAGDPQFVKLATSFAYGEDSAPIKEGRLAGMQSISGTGGLRVFAETVLRNGVKDIYVPDPTWGNHKNIFEKAGMNVHTYRYYDPSNSSIQFSNLISDMKNMPDGSCVLLHVCAHNPTGMDPTMDQWAEISHTMKQKNHLPFFDSAYQGFASGNAPKDAASLRLFVEDGHQCALVQSFSKNFGLYGQRIGALSVVCGNPTEAANVEYQLKVTARAMYSNPPRHGARIVTTVLSDAAMTQDFIDQCEGMADRINDMRVRLRSALEQGGSTRSWEHITKQIGMFAYSGMTPEQVDQITEKHHIYCTKDGRISMAGVTSGNVDYIAHAIHDVTK
mmetsp:Transcript_40322/g.59262  ORF Transcript_40322/g.59262 Transcript_40322/m.59262 type:complete len:433 (+) Transcript_40322:50-1348(+)|eukprot:CAMPEP_0195519670 /NCGR_PEP_ID=MMETSP0794_2-20130614/15239_1 /TAXON_ID=515487 /ORGANISM="Stephanopyxis turris, Strain CCMP 815" /LENGTH=432 /DNA_ID=CAMNT_0040648861 /DNA_START=50 /DNA_END=1348 /DNA_ORIENTATION=+